MIAAFSSRIIKLSVIACNRRYAALLSSQTPLAKKVILPENCDDGFLPLLRNNGKFDPAFLDVENRVRDLSL